MKTHLVTIWYSIPGGKNYKFIVLVKEVIGDNGKAIVYPSSIFKKAFGFTLPPHSTISIH